jgi:type VI secretion system secreted protein VgrG
MKLRACYFLVFPFLALSASATPFLGTGWDFSVLGASTVTNTGATTLNADLGVSPGTAVTGSGTITFSGAPPNNLITSTSIAANGQIAATNAVSAINALPGSPVLNPDLTGGVFSAAGANTVFDVGAATANIDTGGVITLDFEGGSNENIIFVMSTTLITGSASSVDVINANATDNVFWVVGSSATLGTTTAFAGNIIASTAITLDTGATIGCGSVVAQTAAVTLDNNTISDICTYAVTGGTSGTSGGAGSGSSTPVLGSLSGGSPPMVTPEPSTLLYLGAALVSLTLMRAFRRRTV